MMLVFLAGIHSCTMQQLSAMVPQIASFYKGEELQANRLTRVFSRRRFGPSSDPLQMFLAVTDTCFEQEDCSVHFESTMEYNAFGNYRYSQRLFFEIRAGQFHRFDEEAFKKVRRLYAPAFSLSEFCEGRVNGGDAHVCAAEPGVLVFRAAAARR